MASPSSSTVLRRRTILGNRFEIVRMIGSGPLGTVYEAVDRELAALVALKVIHPYHSEQPETMRLVREQMMRSRQLSSPNIVRLYDLELVNNRFNTISTELVIGCNLHELLHREFRNGLPVSAAVAFAKTVLEALNFAHSRGVLHLALKPENVLITAEGHAKVSDFGLSRAVAHELGLTRTGDSCANPLYMAPEQFLEEELDERTDMYACGVLLFELLAGRPPYQDESFVRIAERHLDSAPPSISSVRSDVPSGLDHLVKALMSRERSDRPSAGVALELLNREPLTDESAGAKRVKPRAKRTTPIERRSHDAVLLACFVLIATIIFFATGEDVCRIRAATAVLDVEGALGSRLPFLRAVTGIGDLDPDSAESVVRLIEETPDGEGDWRFAILFKRLSPPALASVSDANGDPILHMLVRRGRRDEIAIAPKSSTLVGRRDRNGITPIYLATQLNRLDELDLLMSIGASPDQRNGDADSPLMYAVRMRDAGLLRRLIGLRNLRLDWGDIEGNTPLHLSARHGFPEGAKILHESFAPLGSRNERGRTPLMEAVLSVYSPRRLQTVRYFLSITPRAVAAARDNDGRTAAEHALASEDPEMIRLFKEHELLPS